MTFTVSRARPASLHGDGKRACTVNPCKLRAIEARGYLAAPGDDTFLKPRRSYAFYACTSLARVTRPYFRSLARGARSNLTATDALPSRNVTNFVPSIPTPGEHERRFSSRAVSFARSVSARSHKRLGLSEDWYRYTTKPPGARRVCAPRVLKCVHACIRVCRYFLDRSSTERQVDDPLINTRALSVRGDGSSYRPIRRYPVIEALMRPRCRIPRLEFQNRPLRLHSPGAS